MAESACLALYVGLPWHSRRVAAILPVREHAAQLRAAAVVGLDEVRAIAALSSTAGPTGRVLQRVFAPGSSRYATCSRRNLSIRLTAAP